MAENLKLITQPESWKQEVKEDVVCQLRDLLSKAETGELQGFIFVGLTIDRCVITAATKNSDQAGLIGGLERVKHRMLASEN